MENAFWLDSKLGISGCWTLVCQQNNRWIRCLVYLFLLFYSSFWISSIGLGGGVVAMVHPIQAPIARTATNAMSTGVAMS